MIVMGNIGMGNIGDGGIIVGPGDIAAEMKTLNAFIESLNADVTNQLLATGREGRWVTTWRTFRREWQAFRDKNSGFWGRIWGSTYDEVLQYRKRAQAFSEQFRTFGATQVTGPALPAPISPPVGDELAVAFRRLAIGGAAVLGLLYVAPYAVQQIRRVAASSRRRAA
jgi:choline dehydrogenase-like flavoprotein